MADTAPILHAAAASLQKIRRRMRTFSGVLRFQ
jgi:uncharacterized protein YcbX